MLGRTMWRWATPTYAYCVDRRTAKRRDLHAAMRLERAAEHGSRR